MKASGMTRGIALAINDFLDNCAEIKPGQEVVLAAQIDGLYGGDNLIDPQVIAWLHAAIRMRGANPSILWIDEPARMHAWRVPPVFMAALRSCDVFINHTFDLASEELKQIQQSRGGVRRHALSEFRRDAGDPQQPLGADAVRARLRDPLSGVRAFRHRRYAVPHYR